MKKITTLVLISVLFLVANQAIAQNLIAVQNGNTPRFFQQVDDAIVNAVDGDTLYIPGGSWYFGKPINKRLHLIGLGHHPDSTKVTFPTTLQGSLTLTAAAKEGSFTGIYLIGNIWINDPDKIGLDYYTFSRCHITYGLALNTSCSNFTFIESIIEGSSSANISVSVTNFSFFNNIFSGSFSNYNGNWDPIFTFGNSIFKNNVILIDANFNVRCKISCSFSSFENNVIYYTQNLSSFSNSIFRNNIFIEGITFPVNTNVGSNNMGINRTDVFVNEEGYLFDYSHDYHLQTNSPGKNAGTDGTDIGIYGGIYPWKEGSIPSNPHFQSIQIAPKTDTNGNLNVKIKVAAQEN